MDKKAPAQVELSLIICYQIYLVLSFQNMLYTLQAFGTGLILGACEGGGFLISLEGHNLILVQP